MRELNATRESVRVITKESMERQAMTDDEDGEVRDGRFMMRGALPARISHSTTNKQSSGFDRSLDHSTINKCYDDTPSASRNIHYGIYWVEMSPVDRSTMDLSSETARLKTAYEIFRINLIDSSGLHTSAQYTPLHDPSDIVFMRWLKQNSDPQSPVIIGFTSIQQANRALNHGLL